jgi:PmbA protein
MKDHTVNDLVQALETAAAFCEKRGAEAECYGIKRNEIIVTVERNDIKLCIKQKSAGVGIRTLIKNAVGFSSCNSLDPDIIRKTAQKAVTMSKKTPPLLCNALAVPGPFPALSGLYDPVIHEFDEKDAVTAVDSMVKAARKDPRVTVDSGEFNAVLRTKAVVTSTGITASEKKSMFSWYIVGMAREKTDVSSFEYQYGSCTHVNQLYLEKTAHTMADNAVANLHPESVAPFTGDIILGPEAVSALIGDPLKFSLNAHNVYRGQSVLATKLHQQIASDILTLKDNPVIPYTHNSSAFDREGSPHQEVTPLKKGVLQQYLYDASAAKREGISSTGNATGTFREMPAIGISNFIIENRSTPLQTLLEETTKGLLISRFSGTSDQISGDFSGACKGAHVITAGAAHPVKGVVISGNVFEILHRITAISKETLKYSRMVLPFIKVADMRIIG